MNDKPCGFAWTTPYRVDITDAVREGENTLQIAVTNTWFNRLRADRDLPRDQRITWTTAPDRLGRRPLQESGLIGPVIVVTD